jgi:hypothetical protein
MKQIITSKPYRLSQVQIVEQALLVALKSIAGDELTNNSRAVQIFTEATNNVKAFLDVHNSTAVSGTAGGITPNILINNLFENMEVLKIESFHSKYYANFKSQLTQMFLPNILTTSVNKVHSLITHTDIAVDV